MESHRESVTGERTAPEPDEIFSGAGLLFGGPPDRYAIYGDDHSVVAPGDLVAQLLEWNKEEVHAATRAAPSATPAARRAGARCTRRAHRPGRKATSC